MNKSNLDGLYICDIRYSALQQPKINHVIKKYFFFKF